MTYLLLLVLSLGFASDNPVPRIGVDGLSLEFEALPFDCNDCGLCGFNTHMVHSPPSGFDGTKDASLHGCTGAHGTCSYHQNCYLQEDAGVVPVSAPSDDILKVTSAAEEVRVAIHSGDITRLRAAMRMPEVTLHVQRRAIQVVGCGGLVVAHFPLGEATVEALQ